MSFQFRPAARENVGLLIGLAGPSGGGKTYTAMRLAKGITPPGQRFAVIDTEGGRATHYADAFAFDHGDLRPPFRPDAYAEAIKAADAAGYPVIIVDSFSHEHAGEGGLLDWHEEEWKRLGGGENVKMLAWVKPKMAHRAMLQRLLQVRAHLILCLRAEEKIDMKKNAQGKMEIVPKQTLAGFKGWVPICEKNLPFELTASFILTPDKPGHPQPIKLEAQHRELFPAERPITEESGRGLAEWAKGGAAPTPPPSPTPAPSPAPSPTPPPPDDRAGLIARIRERSATLGLSKDDRRKLAITHLGSDEADMQTVDLSALQDLLTALKRRT